MEISKRMVLGEGWITEPYKDENGDLSIRLMNKLPCKEFTKINFEQLDGYTNKLPGADFILKEYRLILEEI